MAGDAETQLRQQAATETLDLLIAEARRVRDDFQRQAELEAERGDQAAATYASAAVEAIEDAMPCLALSAP